VIDSTISTNSASIALAISQINASIRELEARYDREPGSVTLLAVSKTKPVSAIQEAMHAGQRAFGENYVDEALEKITTLSNTTSLVSNTSSEAAVVTDAETDAQTPVAGHACEWHFIGGIQSRKTAAIAAHFDWVHSVDRLKIAERLSAQRAAELPPLNICLQVNIDDEATKSGVPPAQLNALVDACRALPNVVLRGLMAIPAPRTEFAEQRAAFAELKSRFNTLQASCPTFDTLSMGMSGDLEAAIAEGATIVRIGTAIFGARDGVQGGARH